MTYYILNVAEAIYNIIQNHSVYLLSLKGIPSQWTSLFFLLFEWTINRQLNRNKQIYGSWRVAWIVLTVISTLGFSEECPDGEENQYLILGFEKFNSSCRTVDLKRRSEGLWEYNPMSANTSLCRLEEGLWLCFSVFVGEDTAEGLISWSNLCMICSYFLDVKLKSFLIGVGLHSKVWLVSISVFYRPGYQDIIKLS